MEDEDNSDNNINDKWENIKTIIKETKQQLIEKDGSTETLKNRWYNKEYKIAIDEIKKVTGKWLIKGRRENEEQEFPLKKRSTQND